ncbi:MAG: hypothetical protein AAGA20_00925 [Planctomycetota bacterium]
MTAVDVSPRSLDRRGAALVPLAFGWIAGMVGWSALFAVEVIDGWVEWRVAAMWLAVCGVAQAIGMLPGVVPFFVWRRRVRDEQARFVPAALLGALVGFAAMVAWDVVSWIFTEGGAGFPGIFESPLTWIGTLSGAATFVVGGRYRRRELALMSIGRPAWPAGTSSSPASND